jgi:hypothetical protein
LSGIRRVPWPIPIAPALRDHVLEGQAVLPALVALGHLASAAVREAALPKPFAIHQARFDRFLPIPRESTELDTLVELAPQENDGVAAALLRRKVSARSAVSRTLVHATALLRPDTGGMAPDDAASPSPGQGPLGPEPFVVTAEALYRELVPFGPAFHNLQGDLALTPQGVRAAVRVPEGLSLVPSASPLGSPFPMDAAFHAACAWCQRYAGCVAIPVGFAGYRVPRPIQAGEVCQCEIRPRAAEALVFDIVIRDADGRLREAMQGLQMQDVSRGRLRPPGWVRAAGPP